MVRMADGSSLAVSAAALQLQREESFRTALRNQKRRLSATERKPSVPDLGISKVQPLLLSREPNSKAFVQCNLDETFNTGKGGTPGKARLIDAATEGAPQPVQC